MGIVKNKFTIEKSYKNTYKQISPCRNIATALNSNMMRQFISSTRHGLIDSCPLSILPVVLISASSQNLYYYVVIKY